MNSSQSLNIELGFTQLKYAVQKKDESAIIRWAIYLGAVIDPNGNSSVEYIHNALRSLKFKHLSSLKESSIDSDHPANITDYDRYFLVGKYAYQHIWDYETSLEGSVTSNQTNSLVEAELQQENKLILGLQTELNNTTKYLQNQIETTRKKLKIPASQAMAHPKLKPLTDKILKLTLLQETLADKPSVPQIVKIQNFVGKFSHPEIKKIFLPQENKHKKRVKNILLAISTFGFGAAIASKIRRGTFAFWKSRSQIYFEKMQKQLKQAEIKAATDFSTGKKSS